MSIPIRRPPSLESPLYANASRPAAMNVIPHVTPYPIPHTPRLALNEQVRPGRQILLRLLRTAPPMVLMSKREEGLPQSLISSLSPEQVNPDS